MEKLRCQSIGCAAVFSEDDNPDDSCTYHDAPIFHDGIKEWSCCKKRSHDFSSFLEIPGSIRTMLQARKLVQGVDGFLCSDHGSQGRDLNSKATNTVGVASSESDSPSQEFHPPPVKKIIDINQPLTCKNKGCGKAFKEKDNHDTACSYHPGSAVFHDRMRGWKCCDIHVKEFDEFMTIPPCTQGWHNAEPMS
ncbi:hypothetical protein ACH5RR_017033 [Cinchona calisaya]|uniref:CHORD domain-containing protein n=1 Tax=Cinchona calisaya TaxID=153742 RepID=A0ABD2ZXP2_9GENT